MYEHLTYAVLVNIDIYANFNNVLLTKNV